MTGRNCIASAFVALCALGGAVLAGPPTMTVAQVSIDSLVRERLGVTAYTLQDSVPFQTTEGLEAHVRVGGDAYTLLLQPSQILATGAVMTLDYGNGNMVDVAPPEMGIYEGVVAGLPGSSVVAQWVGGRFSAMVMQDGKMLWHVQPLNDLQRGLPGHVAYMQSDLLPAAGVCGIEPVVLTSSRAKALVKQGTMHVTDGGLVAEIACEADFNYTSTLGGSGVAVAQDISRVLAWTSKFFTEAVSVRFRIVRYVIRLTDTGNYTNFEAGPLLNAFGVRWNFYFSTTDRDLAHLFTGRDLTGDVIGLASLAVVCNPNSAYGLTQTTYHPALGMRASLAAHEIGHNFGAGHCDQTPGLCAPCGIMLAAASANPTEALHFGCSATPLQVFLNGGGANCLDPGDSLGACRADMNGDGSLTLADFGVFQTAYAMGQVHAADFNHDGVLNLADFGAFKTAFAAGCP